MIDRFVLYNILYALAAKDGREAVLFGNCADAACTAFEHSLACEAFPELWFEIPLAGEPWFDLHALTSRDDLSPEMTFSEGQTGGCPTAFQWFASQSDVVRQLALSWDTGKGEAVSPAVQLLVTKQEEQVTCGFLEAAGRPDAVSPTVPSSTACPMAGSPVTRAFFPAGRATICASSAFQTTSCKQPMPRTLRFWSPICARWAWPHLETRSYLVAS